ncbi:unnamed protein product [Nippostrongylus brasiliensis]|uniref:Kelch-like protein 7 (inferred by orthology to a human protein) n=1 Tax=Nippostrongylus brasiliensis TaxID=27835 RepID=A0A0N4YI99_NIPBR|nr:unnamed protein product [Nippostrongylus brasiliensis]
MASEFVNEKLPAEVLSNLASFRESGTLCDVILEADNGAKAKFEPTSPNSIRAHNVVLTAVSPYFSLLVDYMYNGSLDIDEKNVWALFGAAKILHLDLVRSECLRNSWRAGPETQYCRYGLGVTALDGIIFAVGGEYESQTLREAEMLDPRQGEWISLPSMLNGRTDFGLAAVNGLLYAVGGNSGGETLNSVFFN